MLGCSIRLFGVAGAISLLTTVCLTGCVGELPTDPGPIGGIPMDIDDFAYQLQDIDLTEIGNTEFDLVIIDYSRDGDEASRFTAAEIRALKKMKDMV